MLIETSDGPRKAPEGYSEEKEIVIDAFGLKMYVEKDYIHKRLIKMISDDLSNKIYKDHGALLLRDLCTNELLNTVVEQVTQKIRHNLAETLYDSLKNALVVDDSW